MLHNTDRWGQATYHTSLIVSVHHNNYRITLSFIFIFILQIYEPNISKFHLESSLSIGGGVVGNV